MVLQPVEMISPLLIQIQLQVEVLSLPCRGCSNHGGEDAAAANVEGCVEALAAAGGAEAADGMFMLRVVLMLMLLMEVLILPQMCCYWRWW